MKGNLRTAPPTVLQLIETFDRNRAAYTSPAYHETRLRREFIDPFFTALGWDVANTAGYAPAYQDVIHEDALTIASHARAPDYCFRIGGARKFFLEAKKPALTKTTPPPPPTTKTSNTPNTSTAGKKS